MHLYLAQFTYTADAWKALAVHPSDRREVLREEAAKLGINLVELYYCLGEVDGVAIFEAPDETRAEALMIAAVAAGHLQSHKTMQLLTVEEALVAEGLAGTLGYQAPAAST